MESLSLEPSTVPVDEGPPRVHFLYTSNQTRDGETGHGLERLKLAEVWELDETTWLLCKSHDTTSTTL